MKLRLLVAALPLVLCFACGDKEGAGGSEGGTGEGSGGEGNETGDEDGLHGTVMIELQRSASEPQSPFAGTSKIVAFLDYKECLSNFYLEEHPEDQASGAEGAAVFGAWAESLLCDASRYEKPIVDCEVTDITQTFNTQQAVDITFLRIEYTLASDDIEGLYLPYGPLPTEELAGCTPLVQLNGASVQGFDADDNVIWKIASFDNATAQTNQGAAIKIFVERN